MKGARQAPRRACRARAASAARVLSRVVIWPVRDPSGKLISRFNSTWRLEAPGVWPVVFDKGSPLTEAEKKLP